MSWLRQLVFGSRERVDPVPRPSNGKTWTEDEIFETVADVLVDALGVDRDEVTRDASLVKDLGAE